MLVGIWAGWEPSLPAPQAPFTHVAVGTGTLSWCPGAPCSLPRGIPSTTGFPVHEHMWGRGLALEERLRNMVLLTESFLIRRGEGASTAVKEPVMATQWRR